MYTTAKMMYKQISSYRTPTMLFHMDKTATGSQVLLFSFSANNNETIYTSNNEYLDDSWLSLVLDYNFMKDSNNDNKTMSVAMPHDFTVTSPIQLQSKLKKYREMYKQVCKNSTEENRFFQHIMELHNQGYFTKRPMILSSKPNIIIELPTPDNSFEITDQIEIENLGKNDKQQNKEMRTKSGLRYTPYSPSTSPLNKIRKQIAPKNVKMPKQQHFVKSNATKTLTMPTMIVNRKFENIQPFKKTLGTKKNKTSKQTPVLQSGILEETICPTFIMTQGAFDNSCPHENKPGKCGSISSLQPNSDYSNLNSDDLNYELTNSLLAAIKIVTAILGLATKEGHQLDNMKLLKNYLKSATSLCNFAYNRKTRTENKTFNDDYKTENCYNKEKNKTDKNKLHNYVKHVEPDKCQSRNATGNSETDKFSLCNINKMKANKLRNDNENFEVYECRLHDDGKNISLDESRFSKNVDADNCKLINEGKNMDTTKCRLRNDSENGEADKCRLSNESKNIKVDQCRLRNDIGKVDNPYNDRLQYEPDNWGSNRLNSQHKLTCIKNSSKATDDQTLMSIIAEKLKSTKAVCKAIKKPYNGRVHHKSHRTSSISSTQKIVEEPYRTSFYEISDNYNLRPYILTQEDYDIVHGKKNKKRVCMIGAVIIMLVIALMSYFGYYYRTIILEALPWR